MTQQGLRGTTVDGQAMLSLVFLDRGTGPGAHLSVKGPGIQAR